MEKKIVLAILIGCIITSQVFASAAGAVAAANAAREREREQILYEQKTSGCTPPFNFAQENNCTLKYPTDYRTREIVGAFDCASNFCFWTLFTDCQGTITKSIGGCTNYNNYNYSTYYIEPEVVLELGGIKFTKGGLILIGITFGLLIYLIIKNKINKKQKNKNE